jgi:DNA-binding MurR/RpiR family transcriptional regulator
MPTKLLRQIKNTLPELRKSERLVADFVLKDPKSVITMKTGRSINCYGYK